MGIYRSNPQIGFGSIIITMLTGAAQTYILENWDPRTPVAKIERQNNLSQPNGFVQVTQAKVTQCIAQLSTGSQLPPVDGDEFVVDGVTYVVGEVGQPKVQGEIWKVNFEAREKV